MVVTNFITRLKFLIGIPYSAPLDFIFFGCTKNLNCFYKKAKFFLVLSLFSHFFFVRDSDNLRTLPLYLFMRNNFL